MKKRVIWLVVSCLTVLSLLLTACAPAKVEEKKPPVEVAPKVETPAVPQAVTTTEEKPKYGGTVVVSLDQDVPGFDQVLQTTGWMLLITQHLSYEELIMGDWTRGPAGTKETEFVGSTFAPDGFFRDTGALAESWEIPDNQTLIFKIRKGVHWHNKPPVNGRELDANDIVFTINYHYFNPKLPNAYLVNSAPGGKKLLSATATDKWTVVVKVEDLATTFLEDVGDKMWIVPRESIEKYGSLVDWRNSLGTGAFMLTDYVPGSALTFVRNPNYWMRDPIGPGKGNQLPYLDEVKVLMIPDKSTRAAVTRTGKIDHVGGGRDVFTWEDVRGLLKTNPEIKYKEKPGGQPGVTVRTTSKDPLAAPLMNKRVRWALSMAIDRQEMMRDYYEGKAMMRAYSFYPDSPYYSSDDEMVQILEQKYGFKPEDAQMVKRMWEYHPDEAKKILAEEGYPNGFKTVILLKPTDVDLYSIVKEAWAKIGVELTFDIRELAVYNSIADAHHTQALLPLGAGGAGWPERWLHYGPADPNLPRNVTNRSDITDPIISDYIRRSDAVYGDIPARSKVIKEAEPYIIQLAWTMPLPIPFTYKVWHPWLKNYHGEDAIGYRNDYNWLIWAWLDQDLKKAMRR